MARQKLRHKKLMLKLQYAEAELEECMHTFDACKLDFIKAHEKRLNKLTKATRERIDSFLFKKDREVFEALKEKEDSGAPPPSDIKKLYKEIAKKTHPDKLIHSRGKVRKEKSKLFRLARQALEDLDWINMQKIAIDLDVPLPKISEEQLEMIEKKIQKTFEDLEKIKNTACWQWYHLQSAEEKESFIEAFVQSMFGELINENS